MTLVLVALGLFLAVLSTTVVSVALPGLGRDLHASSTELQWVVDAYVLIYASLLLPGGALGDRYGRKGLFVIGLGLFCLGSLIAGAAPSLSVLLVGRVIQAVGPALAVPASLTIIRAVFTDPNERAAAIGLWSTSSGVAMALGPPIGGILVATIGWRAVFWINVPLTVAVIALCTRLLPRLPRTPANARFDWAGAMLSSSGVALLAIGLIEGQARGWTSPLVIGAFVLGTVALLAFVMVERRRAHPLIDIGLFRSRAFSMANVAAFVVFFAFVGAIIYLSAYFQQVQGHSALTAGLALTAIGIPYAVAASVCGRLVPLLGERWLLAAGLLIAGAATLGLLRLGVDTGMPAIWWNLALIGIGSGLAGPPMSTMAMSAVDSDRAGQASAVVNAARQIGQVFGVAVLGVLVYASLPGTTGTVAHLAPAAQTAFVAGLRSALWVAGLALLATGIATAVLLRHHHART